MIKNCQFCKKEFNARHSYNKFCGVKCFGLSEQGENNHRWKGGKVSAKCLSCSKIFLFQKRKRAKGILCSLECKAQWQKNIGLYKKENNPMWRGGVTPLALLLRTSERNITWRKEIFKRDNYTCVKCGVRNGIGIGKTVYLEADHYPVSFATLLQEARETDDFTKFWDISNGRTLCRPCHDKTKNGKPKKVKNNFSIPIEVKKTLLDGSQVNFEIKQ